MNPIQQKMTKKEFDRLYPTDSTCLRKIFEYRTRGTENCYSCGSPFVKYLSQLANRKCFKCTLCHNQFYPMVNSIMDNSHVSPKYWCDILFDMISNRNGISIREIKSKYGISKNTAKRITDAIRRQMQACLDFEFENCSVEIDETYVKTGRKGFLKNHKFKTGRGSEQNSTILAIVERRGFAKMFVIDAADAENIIPIILKHVSKTCIVYTDQWPTYKVLKNLGYNHAVVNHSAVVNRFVDGSASTNACENLFSNFKRNHRGTHRSMSEKHLPLYLAEFCFRHNYKNERDYGLDVFMRSLPPLSDTYNKPAVA
jgi:transposase-like protein